MASQVPKKGNSWDLVGVKSGRKLAISSKVSENTRNWTQIQTQGQNWYISVVLMQTNYRTRGLQEVGAGKGQDQVQENTDPESQGQNSRKGLLRLTLVSRVKQTH